MIGVKGKQLCHLTILPNLASIFTPKIPKQYLSYSPGEAFDIVRHGSPSHMPWHQGVNEGRCMLFIDLCSESLNLCRTTLGILHYADLWNGKESQ